MLVFSFFTGGLCGVGGRKCGVGGGWRVELCLVVGVVVECDVGGVVEVVTVAYWKEARAPPSLASLPFFVLGLCSGIWNSG